MNLTMLGTWGEENKVTMSSVVLRRLALSRRGLAERVTRPAP
jgi:hypothetical protein